MIYQYDTKKWAKISNIDEFTSSIAAASISGTSSYAVPLATVLSEFYFFNPVPETLKLAKPEKKELLSSSKYRKLMKEFAYTKISDEMIKEIAFYSHVPEIMNPYEFERWWEKTDGLQGKGSVARPEGAPRSASEARSIQEMHIILSAMVKEGKETLDISDTDRFIEFFSSMKPVKALKDDLLLAEALAMISLFTGKDEFAKLIVPLKGKTLFWPEAISSARLETLDTWGLVPAKYLPVLTDATALLFDRNYLAEMLLILPQRCLSNITAKLDESLILETLKATKTYGSDVLLWIWKNRSKSSASMQFLINMENIVSALSVTDLPKTWGASQRELKRLLIEKDDFQKLVIKNADGDIQSIVTAMHKSKSIHSGEQQSILVKLSRHSTELRGALEGEGKKLAAKTPERTVHAPLTPVTSAYSYNVRLKELDDIIKIHTPENRESLKTARAHGDFRENAEYDAAKERRNYLASRRAELEQNVNYVHKIDFRTVKPEDTIVIGSTVKLEMKNGKTETFYLLGAWDGDPDNGCISYKTRLGEILLGARVGETLTLLDDSECKVAEVSALPEKILKKYSDEK